MAVKGKGKGSGAPVREVSGRVDHGQPKVSGRQLGAVSHPLVVSPAGRASG